MIRSFSSEQRTRKARPSMTVATIPQSSMRPILALGAALALWASSFPATRIALQHFGSGELILFRCAVASVVLLAYAFRLQPEARRWPLRIDAARIVANGLLSIAMYQLLFNYGMRTISSGPAAVLVDTVPIFTALFAALFLRERMTWLGWVGTLAGFGGVVLIAAGEAREFQLDLGAFCLLGAAVCFALSMAVAKPLVRNYGSIIVTASSFAAAAISMLWFAPSTIEQVAHAPSNVMLGAIYLTLGPSVLAYVGWGVALAHLPIALVSSSLYLIPPLAFLFAWIWLGEKPSWLSAFGTVIVLAGVLLVHYFGIERHANRVGHAHSAN